ncbi:MAG: tail fiber domain-containing protein [Planctomycetota bacterium]
MKLNYKSVFTASLFLTLAIGLAGGPAVAQLLPNSNSPTRLNFPTAGWSLDTFSGGRESGGIEFSSTTSRGAFTMTNGAPEGALSLGTNGLGIGLDGFNSLPQATLHVSGGGTSLSDRAYPNATVFVDDRNPTSAFRRQLLLSNRGGAGLELINTDPGQTSWAIDSFNFDVDGTNHEFLNFFNNTSLATPFRVKSDAFDRQVTVWRQGLSVGRIPETQPASGIIGNLEVYDDGTGPNGGFASITSRVDDPASRVPRTSMHLENNGGIFMTFKDSVRDSEWSFGNSNDALRLGRTGGSQPGFLLTSTGNFLFQFDQNNDSIAENIFFVTPNGTAFGTDFSRLSDRNAKENFQPVNPQEILTKVANIPITRWNYKQDKDQVEHIGPMAQDFFGAFEVGISDKRLSDVDTTGVALAAIQALHQNAATKDQLIQTQAQKIEEQAEAIAELNDRLDRLEAMVSLQNQ